MRRSLAAAMLGVFLVLCSVTTTAEQNVDRLWIAPNPGSLDLLRMFERPEEWARTRELISVFQFTQQHTFRTPGPVTGPNTYDALVQVGAFRKLSEWRIKIGLGVWAVKEFYCTPDASGMQEAVTGTLSAVGAVQGAGGLVQYLAMDEPFLAGRSARCGGPSLAPTADRLATYFAGVRQSYPLVRIGLVEAYPTFKPDAFDAMLALMDQRNITPAFLHIDVDLLAVRPERDDLATDIQRIHELCAARHIPFGVIVWGYNGNADALFAADAAKLAHALKQAFPEAGAMPDQLAVESWSPSATGALLTPSNLPEDRAYTLTNLVWQIFRRFLAAADATVGNAVGR